MMLTTLFTLLWVDNMRYLQQMTGDDAFWFVLEGMTVILCGMWWSIKEMEMWFCDS